MVASKLAPLFLFNVHILCCTNKWLVTIWDNKFGQHNFLKPIQKGYCNSMLQLNQNVPLCLLHFQVPTGNLLWYPEFCHQFGLQNIRCLLLPIHVLWSLVSIDQFYLRNIHHEGHMQIESNLSTTILPEVAWWDINCKGDYNVLFKNMNWLLRLGQIAWQLFMPMPICIWTTRLNILSWQTNCSTASHHFFNWLSVRSLASHVNSVSLLLPNGPRIELGS